ncbi:hypothetical protein DRO69_09755 [Candidatus Bathyarchaeota archaeon]|nr:MAG: hypothetical protein DRO69_09755 [Candidatus Bathyarchaeota archaeon]
MVYDKQIIELKEKGFVVEILYNSERDLQKSCFGPVQATSQAGVSYHSYSSLKTELQNLEYKYSGDSDDWLYGVHNIAAFTIDLRPKTLAEGGFVLPSNQIIPTWEENKPAALYLIVVVPTVGYKITTNCILLVLSRKSCCKPNNHL